MAQIRQVVSEQLQSTIRRLLPSQQGFTEDLQASNVITPIIDLTPSAEGSQLPDYLQKALAFGDITAFDVSNTTTTLMNSPGFWLLEFTAVSLRNDLCRLEYSDGLSVKYPFRLGTGAGVTATINESVTYRNVFCLSAGDSVSAAAANTARIAGNYRQIADISGNLVNPDGYTP